MSAKNSEFEAKELFEVAVVLVTYNRRADLDRAVQSIEQQFATIKSIYIIDNASTDDTASYLNDIALRDKNGKYRIIRQLKNEGGAGGFHCGMREAFADGHGWVWLMDDDCIPGPNALDRLADVAAMDIQNVGFICSHVVWRDQSPHEMNLPGIKLHAGTHPYNQFIGENALVVRSCSFVSVLISRDAVVRCGLPISEMFIWGDDIEYTSRITSTGMLGLYAFKSIVSHHTKQNMNDALIHAERCDFWKHYFGVRNNLFIVRKSHGPLAYIYSLLAKLTFDNYEILIMRRTHRIQATLINTKASLASLFFFPKIEFLKTNGEDQ